MTDEELLREIYIKNKDCPLLREAAKRLAERLDLKCTECDEMYSRGYAAGVADSTGE